MHVKQIEDVRRQRGQLAEARALLERRGWAQAAPIRYDGVCIEAALAMTTRGEVSAGSSHIGHTRDSRALVARLYDEIEARGEHIQRVVTFHWKGPIGGTLRVVATRENIQGWNDIVATDREQVYSVIDATLARMDAWLSEHDVADPAPAWVPERLPRRFGRVGGWANLAAPARETVAA